MLSPAQHYYISALITSVAAFVFGIFVLAKSPNKRLANHFAWYAYTISHWSFFVFACTSVTNHEWSYVLAQICHFIGVFIPVAFLHFVVVLVKNNSRSSIRIIKVSYAAVGAISLAILIKPRLFITDVVQKLTFNYFPVPGPLFYVWNSLFVILVVISSAVLLTEALKKSAIEKRRLISFLTANSLGYLGGIGCFFPVYGINLFPFPYGIWGVFFFVCVTFYAVLRYQFIDIEVIIKKTLVFAGIVAAAVSVIAFPLALIQAVIGKAFGVPDPFILMALGIATTVLIYRPVERFLVNVTDKYLFQKKINYRLLLREASEYLAHVDSLKQQARNIVAFLLKKARIASASVYAFAAPDKSSLLLKASRPFISDDQLQRISLSHPLIEYFSKHQGPVEINALKEAGEDNARSHGFDEILALMKSLQAEAAIPCFGGEAASKFDKKSSRLKGVLFLGHQKSDEPYSEEDLDVFFTLGQESSIAFENARLYDEAINRSLELQKMNEELSKTQKELIVSLSDVEQANVRLKETHAALLEEKKRAVLAGLGKSMAHEIRNPITPINSHLYFGRKRLQEMKNVYEANLSKPSEANNQKFLTNFNSAMEMLSEIEKSKDRIQGIVNTLYNLVAQKTGNKVEVKLDMVAESAIEEVKYQNYWETLSQPDIKNRIPRQLPFALGIPQDIQGVFVNLIINALHAMEKTADKRITIDAMIDQDNPDMIKIEFTDNGCGIPEELQEKIFEHGFTTKGGKGTGLGLFYCKNIIEQVHGGTISVKSQVGNGTCFTIRLPRFKKEDEKRRP